jgi:hypothetical protein
MGLMDAEPHDISGDEPQQGARSAPNVRADAKREAGAGARTSNPLEGVAKAVGQKIGDVAAGAGRAKKAIEEVAPKPTAEGQRQISEIQENPLKAIWHQSGLNPQNDYQALRTLGRAYNALLDEHAIHNSIHSVNSDNTLKGKLLRAGSSFMLSGGHLDEDVLPTALTLGASLPAGVFAPQMMAGLPEDQIGDVPGAAAKEVGGAGEQLIKHPGELRSYQRAGMVLLNGAMLLGPTQKGARLATKLPGLSKVADHIASFAFTDRPAERIPWVMDSGRRVDPYDKKAAANYGWIKRSVEDLAPVEEVRKLAGKPVEGKAATVAGEMREAAGKRMVRRVLGEEPTLEGINALHPKAQELIFKHWEDVQRAYGFKAALSYWHPGEAENFHPLEVIGQMDKAQRGQAMDLVGAGNRLIGHVVSGPHGHHEDPVASLMHSSVYGHRLTDRLATQFVKGAESIPKAERDKVMPAIEDSTGELAKALSPAAKGLYAQLRQVYGVLGEKGVELKRFTDRVPGYVPRLLERPASKVDALPKGPSVQRLMTGSSFHRSRKLVEAEDGSFQIEQKYGSIAEANKEFASRRKELAEAILGDHPEMDPKLAAKHAAEHIPNFSTDVVQVLAKDLARSIKNTHHVEVMDKLANAHTKVDGLRVPAAFKLRDSKAFQGPSMDASLKRLSPGEQAEHLRKLGYRTLEGTKGEFLVHPGFSGPWNRTYQASLRDQSKGLKLARTLTRWGLTAIMFDPLWHAWNMVGRGMDLAFTHPVTVAKSIWEQELGHKLGEQDARQRWEQTIDRAVAHGHIYDLGHQNHMGELLHGWGQATGDAEVGTALGEAVSQAPQTWAERSVGQKVGSVAMSPVGAYNHVNGWFRQRYSDLGVLAFMAEEKHALARGLDPSTAAILGATRGNAWKGAVAPEQWASNPMAHQASQLLAFAPNWWRSYVGLAAGRYYAAGIAPSKSLARYWAINQAKTMFGMWFANSLSGNAINYLTSGHMQYENQPGNKNSWEMDRFTPPDLKTGKHTVMENVFARQQKDTWAALGLSAPPEDYAAAALDPNAPAPAPWDPTRAVQTIFAREGVLPQSAAVASNLDLYGTIKAGMNAQWVDPEHPGWFAGGDPAAEAKLLAAAGMALTPFGIGTQRAIQPPPPDGRPAPDGSFGSDFPQWAQDVLGIGTKDKDAQWVGAAFGVRGPYQAAEKGPGEGMSTTKRMEVNDHVKQYDEQLAAQETKVAQGDMTLDEWARMHHDASAFNAGYMQSAYEGVAEADSGAAGVMNRWEKLYNYKGSDGSVTLEDGEINHVLLDKKRAELESEVKSRPDGVATWNLFQSEIHKGELKHPIVKTYNDTMKAYDSFQGSYASSHGTTQVELKSELSSYYNSGTAKERVAYERAHPVLQDYFKQKRNWERTTRGGFLYGMFTKSSYISDLKDHLGRQGQAQVIQQSLAAEEADIAKQKAASGG